MDSTHDLFLRQRPTPVGETRRQKKVRLTQEADVSESYYQAVLDFVYWCRRTGRPVAQNIKAALAAYAAQHNSSSQDEDPPAGTAIPPRGRCPHSEVR